MQTHSLEYFRSQLDQMDADLVRILGKRFAVCEAIAAYKLEHGIPMMQPDRIAIVKERVAELARSEGLEASVVSALYDLIISAACELEIRVMCPVSSGEVGV